MPLVKIKTSEPKKGKNIVSDEIKSHANDPFLVKKAADARESLSKVDLSVLKGK